MKNHKYGEHEWYEHLPHYGLVEGILEIDGKRIDLAATWKLAMETRRDWVDRLGLSICDGRLVELSRSASEMGRGPGELVASPVSEDKIVYAGNPDK